MRKVIVKIARDYCGLWPRTLDLFVRTGKELPQVGDEAVLEDKGGKRLAEALVESVDHDSRTYKVRIW